MPAKTTAMHVSITTELRHVVDERLRSGLYESASEYVRDLYQTGIDSGASEPLTEADWATLRAVARSPAGKRA
jgi:Arc/MetJ-type ribon-helix-helix transcriptional regulator